MKTEIKPERHRVIDVDAHFGEPKDWLATVAPGLAAEFPPAVTYVDMIQEAVGRTMYAFLPGEGRPQKSAKLLTTGFVDFLEGQADRQPEQTDGASSDPNYTASGRLRFCDEHNIDVQFLNPTFWRREHVWCRVIDRPDLRRAVTAAWNTCASAQLAGHTNRR